MTESEFYASVNTCYFQLQKLFPVLSNYNLPDEKLISRSFKMLTSIIVSEIILVFLYLFMRN